MLSPLSVSFLTKFCGITNNNNNNSTIIDCNGNLHGLCILWMTVNRVQANPEIEDH